MGTFYLKNFIGDSEFPFFIQYGRHERSLDMHSHADFFELTIVLEGTALHTVNGESYFIKKGDVFGVNDVSQHSFTECRNFNICNIMFKPEVVFAPFPDLKHCPGFHSLFVLEPNMTFKSRLKLNITDFEVTSGIIARMVDEYSVWQPGRVATMTAYFIELVSYLIRRYDEEQPVSDKITAFSRAVAFMERNFTQKLTLAEIAAAAGFSVRHFQRLFKNTYLISPQEYITSLRMQKAVQLLKNTRESVTDIAWECGYEDSNLFSRRFKKYTGLSPRNYREQMS